MGPDMTSQQHADLALQQWQAMRDLTPEERIDMLMFDFFFPPPISEAEYQIQLSAVSVEMANPEFV